MNRWGETTVVSSISPGGRGGDQDESVGRDPPPASGEGVPKKEIARRPKVGRQDGAPGRRPTDATGAGVAASGQQPGPVAGRDRAVAARGPEVDRERIRRLLLPLAGAVSPRTVRRYVAGLRRSVTSKEAFVDRSVAAGTTMEVDLMCPPAICGAAGGAVQCSGAVALPTAT